MNSVSEIVTRKEDMCQTLQNKGCWREFQGAAVAEWLSSWLAEQEDRGSIPGLAT